jgi:hypothetical protein
MVMTIEPQRDGSLRKRARIVESSAGAAIGESGSPAGDEREA